MRQIGLLAIGVLVCISSLGLAQYPYPLPPPPPPLQTPPLLYVKFVGPAGMKVTFYRGGIGQTATAPCTFGFRPGFSFRCKLSDIPGMPNLTVYPTLEVRGSLILGKRLRNADFPAALVFRTEDFKGIRSGGVITKIVVLEHPELALPLPSKADDPIQIDVPSNQSPFQESLARGRTLLVVHMGQRQLSEFELAGSGVPGTVLMPGEKALPLPRQAPSVPWACYSVYDPILGPPHPGGEVTLPDGGDTGLQAGIDRYGKLRGLDPSDTVAQYTDSRGKSHIAVSNRVGLCVPRFVIFRGETGLASQVAQVGPGRATTQVGRQLLLSHVPPLEQHQNQELRGMTGEMRPSSNVNTVGTAIVGKLEGITVTASATTTGTVAGSKEPPITEEPHDLPLKIIKFPDKTGALIDDIVTFTIRFWNVGGRPITNVIVSDSLTTRFEYVPGSSKSDRPSTFTTQANDAGSTVLRWAFPGTLQAGETGVVSFQVKIR